MGLAASAHETASDLRKVGLADETAMLDGKRPPLINLSVSGYLSISEVGMPHGWDLWISADWMLRQHGEVVDPAREHAT